MFDSASGYSVVTAVMPNRTANRVLDVVLDQQPAGTLSWKSRGTLLHDHWWKRWLPPVSPARTMMQMIAATSDVPDLMSRVVRVGRLDRQAIGAAFSTPCEHVFFGSETHARNITCSMKSSENVKDTTEKLSAIFCVVSHESSDRVARAAIDAGAHGPVVYYCEGRGLRDRLGWLRITKEHEKEVLVVMADQGDVEEVFDAMAKAGQLDRPGRGFMYRVRVDHGVYNLPSRVSHHHYDATMQQMIHAIDHLAGHKHWRDQEVVDFGYNGKGVGLNLGNDSDGILKDQVCLSSIVLREQSNRYMELLLDAGAPGLNFGHARFVAPHQDSDLGSAQVNGEYTLIRSVISKTVGEQLVRAVEDQSDSAGVKDLCLFAQAVPRVATYVPGNREHRKHARAA